RKMIAAAAVAILAEDHANRVAPVNLFDGAGKFARRGFSVLDLAISRENPHAVGAARRRIGAHNVVIQRRTDRVSLFLGPLKPPVGTEQPLLFAREHAKEKRGAKLRASACGGCA